MLYALISSNPYILNKNAVAAYDDHLQHNESMV